MKCDECGYDTTKVIIGKSWFFGYMCGALTMTAIALLIRMGKI
jgi:hypothetical protein